MKNFILELLSNVKDYKKLAWIFILIVLFLIVIYPIIDANFLYYKRVSNRIEILDKVNNIDVNSIDNKQLKDEYKSILNEISEKEDKYLNNIFIHEESLTNNIIKFISAAWLFIIAGIFVPFAKDNKKMKLGTKIFCVCFCFLIAAALGYVGYIIPTIINVAVNVILYIIILVFLAYTISKVSLKK